VDQETEARSWAATHETPVGRCARFGGVGAGELRPRKVIRTNAVGSPGSPDRGRSSVRFQSWCGLNPSTAVFPGGHEGESSSPENQLRRRSRVRRLRAVRFRRAVTVASPAGRDEDVDLEGLPGFDPEDRSGRFAFWSTAVASRRLGWNAGNNSIGTRRFGARKAMSACRLPARKHRVRSDVTHEKSAGDWAVNATTTQGPALAYLKGQ